MTIDDLNENGAWINTGSRIVKVNIWCVILSIEDEAERQIMTLLKSMKQYKTTRPPAVISTEVIDDHDPRSQSDQLNAVKQEKIEGLTDRGAFKTTNKEEIGIDTNILVGGFLLIIKVKRSSDQKYKARFAVHGRMNAERI